MFQQTSISSNTSTPTEATLDGLIDLSGKSVTFSIPKLSFVLWDCDNSALETERPALNACYDVLRDAVDEWSEGQFTFDVSKEHFVASHTGGSFRDMLTNYLRMVDTEFEERQDQFLEFVENWSRTEQDRVIDVFKRDGITPTRGTELALNRHVELGLRPVIVSSSAPERLSASLETAGVARHFQEGDIYSAQDEVFMKAGGERKPAPDIYIHAMSKLKISHNDCIAIEDSKSGVLSALRAGIGVVYYVGAESPSPSRKQIETFLAEVERELNAFNDDRSANKGKILAVIDDNSCLPDLVNSLRSATPYQPLIVNHSK
jgi:HAD superfamily hydrolase (TIGR01509 family)